MITTEDYKKVAETVVGYSMDVQKGENVQMDLTDIPNEMVVALVDAVYARGGNPFPNLNNSTVTRAMLKGTNPDQQQATLELGMEKMKKMDCYLAMRGSVNGFQYSDLSKELAELSKVTRPIIDYRVNNTKWCVMVWPTSALAQAAEMSTEEMEELYFKVCTYDYRKMAEEADALVNVMNRTDRVWINGNGTDLRFSIKDIPAIPCCGLRNVPDGEVYSAPVKDSINGVIRYNCQTNYQGQVFNGIELTVENGKIVEATCDTGDVEALNKIFDTDDGSRYFGEFAIGINPMITKGMNNILFDEKIYGSFHLTPGKCYEEASNGNDSGIHWDLVNIQTPEYGGGEIWFDGKLIRKDGEFMIEELKGLNR